MDQARVYVGNFPYTVAEEQLRDFFAQYGEITDCKLIMDRETGSSRGFAFITFASAEIAQASLSADGEDFEGRALRVNIAREDSRGGGSKRPARHSGSRDRY